MHEGIKTETFSFQWEQEQTPDKIIWCTLKSTLQNLLLFFVRLSFFFNKINLTDRGGGSWKIVRGLHGVSLKKKIQNQRRGTRNKTQRRDNSEWWSKSIHHNAHGAGDGTRMIFFPRVRLPVDQDDGGVCLLTAWPPNWWKRPHRGPSQSDPSWSW